MLHCFYIANNGVSSHLFPINSMNRLRLWRQWRQVGREEEGYWDLQQHAHLGSPCLHYNRTIILLSLAFRDDFQLYACWICGFAVTLCRDLPIITSWQAGDGELGLVGCRTCSYRASAMPGLVEGPWEQLELLPPRVISICIRSACCNLQQVLQTLQ